MPEGGSAGRALRAGTWGLAALLVAHFLFVRAIVAHGSWTALLAFVAGCGLALPAARSLPPWLRGTLAIVLLGSANALLGTGGSEPPQRVPTAFVGATVLTGHRDAAPIADAVVLVDADGRIADVGTKGVLPVPDGYEVVDLDGHTLLPGLLNAHAHLLLTGREPGEPLALERFAMPEWLMETLTALLDSYPGRWLALWQMEKNARSALEGGVTTLRGLGDPGFGDVQVRERIAAGQAVGPRVLASGPLICVTGGHGHPIGQVVDGPDEARRAVRKAVRRGVDHIKIASTGGVSDSRRLGEAGELQMTPEEIEAVTDEAHRKNILVAAHVESAQGVLEALRAGVDSIEHGAELSPEAIALFRENPKALRGFTTLHPTLSVIAGEMEISDAAREDPLLFVMVSNGIEIKRRILEGYRQARAGGVRVAVGTDAGIVRHDAVWKEMLYFVEIGGLSHAEALHLGTLATAESIGIADRTGSIEAGKSADLLVVAGDPLVDLHALDTPVLVVADGVVHRLR